MKKRVFAVAVVVLCLALAVGSTVAYFTDNQTAHNVISTGMVGIEVVEQQEQDGVLVDYPKEPITDVMPGSSVSKIVTVKNVGSDGAWIRISVEKSLTMAENAPEKLPEGEKPDLELLKLDCNTEPQKDGYWILEDGWFYYSRPLNPGESTAPLFRSVEFSADMSNAYQGCTAHILVNAQALQSRNNELTEGGRLSQLPGWPASEESTKN